MKRILLWILGILSILIFLLVVFTFRFVLFGNHANLNNAVSASWLPREATNIFSRNKGSYEIYEFNIGEEKFLIWAKEKGLTVTPIEGESIQVARYYQSDAKKSERKDCFSGFGEKLTDAEVNLVRKCTYENAGIHIAKIGYHGENRRPNGGGYSVIFDGEENKVYYNWSTH